MAISGGDWASATDPFILALAVSYTGTLGELSSNRIRLDNSTGFLNGIIDKDLQDLFWQNDANPDLVWPVAAVETIRNAGPAADQYEFGGFLQDIGGGTFYAFESNDMIEADPKHTRIYVAGRAAGASLYSLFAYIAFAWQDRDPAQILFSWVAHHLDNSIFTMKDYLDQTSFQNASAYYDANPCPLALVRETGKAIADQVKTLFHHTADFVGIVPAAADGAVKMRIFVRGALDDRTTPIVLSGKSVASYSINPTDRYRVDRIDAQFGSLVMIHGTGSCDDSSDFITGFPIEFAHDSINQESQKVGALVYDNVSTVSAPYHQARAGLTNHIDLRYWILDQDEVEIEFADWSHFNFEAGDVVHLIGESYDGTEDFLVMEKTPNLDSLLASARFIQLHGHEGKTPRYADGANLIFHLRANELGYFVDGNEAFPKTVARNTAPRNLDRWFDVSGKYAHATQIDRGTGGPSGANPSPPKMILDAVNRWPALEFDGLSGMKQYTVGGSKRFNGPNTVGVASDLTFYAVVRVDDVAAALDVIWNYSYLGAAISFQIASGVPYYNSGAGAVGSGSALAGWQIIVWTLKAAASSTIRRNGVQLHSGGAYTAIALNSLAEVAIGCNYAGNTFQFDGAIAELAMFKGAHSAATSQQIEAHLAQKYGITI